MADIPNYDRFPSHPASHDAKTALKGAEVADLRADLKAVAVALLTHATIGAHTGWRCNLCRGHGPDKWRIQHKDGCSLARPGVRAVLEGVKDG